MDEALYKQFVQLWATGNKVQARERVRRFIDSFESFEQKQAWAREFLKRGESGHKIRHEIYSELIFPVLEHGFHEGDFECTLWLARTSENLYLNRELHARVGFLGEHALLKRGFEMRPQDAQVRRLLLSNLLDGFDYAQHEWPSGILYGSNGAAPEECDELAGDVVLARELDEQGEYAAFLDEFESKLKQYQERLRSHG